MPYRTTTREDEKRERAPRVIHCPIRFGFGAVDIRVSCRYAGAGRSLGDQIPWKRTRLVLVFTLVVALVLTVVVSVVSVVVLVALLVDSLGLDRVLGLSFSLVDGGGVVDGGRLMLGLSLGLGLVNRGGVIDGSRLVLGDRLGLSLEDRSRGLVLSDSLCVGLCNGSRVNDGLCVGLCDGSWVDDSLSVGLCHVFGLEFSLGLVLGDRMTLLGLGYVFSLVFGDWMALFVVLVLKPVEGGAGSDGSDEDDWEEER